MDTKDTGYRYSGIVGRKVIARTLRIPPPNSGIVSCLELWISHRESQIAGQLTIRPVLPGRYI
ncbi:hypothetical protein BJX64DRAFT_252356 [Aspergillus heterothallicus]